MKSGKDEEDRGQEEEGDEERGAPLVGAQKVLVAQISAELTLDSLLIMRVDAKRQMDTLRAKHRSRAGGHKFEAAQRVHRNCDAAITAFKQFNDAEIAECAGQQGLGARPPPPGPPDRDTPPALMRRRAAWFSPASCGCGENARL